MNLHEALFVLQERHRWMCARVVAKQGIGRDTTWDERERDALHTVIKHFQGGSHVEV